MANGLQKFFGVFWPMVKPHVSGIKIEFDTANKAVLITKGDTLHVLKFEDIEKAVNGEN